jgi:hypothetical protein
MNVILEKLRNAGRDAWLKFVRWMNGASAALLAAASAAYAKYPDAAKHFIESVPGWIAFPAAVGFFLVIDHALKRAKDAA